MALDPYLFALLLEQASEAGVMNPITLNHGHWCGLSVSNPDRRIVLGDMRDGRTLRVIPQSNFLGADTCVAACKYAVLKARKPVKILKVFMVI